MRALAAVALLVTTPALAQPSVEAFYKGRTVEMTIGTQPGGGSSPWRRSGPVVAAVLMSAPLLRCRRAAGRR